MLRLLFAVTSRIDLTENGGRVIVYMHSCLVTIFFPVLSHVRDHIFNW